MKQLALLSLLFGLLGASIAAHAEGGTCPNGYYPINSPGVMGCAPIPGYNQQQFAPPPRWEDRWGAIATGKRGVLGTVSNALSQSAAEQVAMTDCQVQGGINCKIQVSYVNGCGVMVIDEGGYNVGNAPDLNQAIQSGMKVCRDAGASNCRVYYSSCSSPVQIQ